MCADDLNTIINFKHHENLFGTSQPVARKKTRKELMEMFCKFLLRKSPKISSRLIYVTWFAIFYIFCKICVFYRRVQSVITKLHKSKSQFYLSGKIEGKRSNWVQTRVSTKTLEMSAAFF